MIRPALWRGRSAGRPRPQPPGRLRPLLLATLGALAATDVATAHDLTAQTVEVSGHHDLRLGVNDSASAGTIGAALLKSRPVLRPGEVLEFVPGLVVTQHSGDGKANQYFLRGFNLDHGTDFATSVNGMPVNMPTHAHGQGYTDLNFLLPELVQRIHYQKGPYHARSGDFSAAGAADIVYRTRLEQPFAQLSLGAHGHRRAVLGGSTALGDDRHLLAAVETSAADGPWTVPQRLRRHNGVLTLSGGTAAAGWQASLMAYDARWTATDQVPQRLIDGGSLGGQAFGRFDSLDASSGGRTARHSLSAAWHRAEGDTTTRLNAYLMRYRLDLWSNFTYALARPDEGDQFLQQDRRTVAGLGWSQGRAHELAGLPARTEWGLQLRHDDLQVGLADTRARAVLRRTRDDAVRQTFAGLWVQTDWEPHPAWRVVLGARLDRVQNRVQDRVAAISAPDNSGQARGTRFSPKASLIGQWTPQTEWFLNAGSGLHSNDARGTTIRRDPATGQAAERVPALVGARGWELGLRSHATADLHTTLALWQLDTDSELVYVGDGGGTEPQAAGRRRGLEASLRWLALPGLSLDADLAFTRSRLAGDGRIPNAVDRVAALGLAWRPAGRAWRASLQLRHLGPAALTEDNRQRSPGTTMAQARLAWDLAALSPALFKRGSELSLDVFNLGNRRGNDIQYHYTSRLPGEAAPVDDRHVHPAEPRQARLTLRVAL